MLVDEVRDKLRQVVRGMPAAERVYAEIKARASTRFAPLTVANIVGPDNAALVAGSHVVSGAFSVDAWREYVQNAIRMPPPMSRAMPTGYCRLRPRMT